MKKISSIYTATHKRCRGDYKCCKRQYHKNQFLRFSKDKSIHQLFWHLCRDHSKSIRQWGISSTCWHKLKGILLIESTTHILPTSHSCRTIEITGKIKQSYLSVFGNNSMVLGSERTNIFYCVQAAEKKKLYIQSENAVEGSTSAMETHFCCF